MIGAGGIGGTHLRAYAELPDLCEIVGVADIHVPAAQERVARFGGQAFQDYVTLLDTLQPDAISICTPPNLHLAVATAAAQRNIHMLCESRPRGHC